MSRFFLKSGTEYAFRLENYKFSFLSFSYQRSFRSFADEGIMRRVSFFFCIVDGAFLFSTDSEESGALWFLFAPAASRC